MASLEMYADVEEASRLVRKTNGKGEFDLSKTPEPPKPLN